MEGRTDHGEAPPFQSPLADETVLSPWKLHPEVGIASHLFKDGHYDEAVRKASQRFVNRVQEMADRPDLDGHRFDEPGLFGELRLAPIQ